MDIFENEYKPRSDEDDSILKLFSFNTSSDFPIKTGEFEGGGPGGTDVRNERTQDYSIGLLDALKKGGSSLLKYIQDNPGKVGLMGLLAALGAMNKAPPSGGGVEVAYKGPSKALNRVVSPSRHGPVSYYAAKGGIMHAYANGGQVKPVAMEDGGFVMTKKAVDGAGGPRGIQSLLPGARPIRGPGTGTSDSIPAYIQGRNSVTPARVSNGEAYVPRKAQPPGGTRQLYALMRQLERRA